METTTEPQDDNEEQTDRATVPTMQRVKQSNNIAAVGYEPATRSLFVEFRSGTLYVYFDVPQNVHQGMMEAESKGRYFMTEIRDGGFTFQRLEKPEGMTYQDAPATPTA